MARKNDPSYLLEACGFLFSGGGDFWWPAIPGMFTRELLALLLCYATFDQVFNSIYHVLVE